MSRAVRFTALALSALLLAVPAVWACSQMGGVEMACPMAASMHEAVAGHTGESLDCADPGGMEMDCCPVDLAPETPATRASASAKTLDSLDALAAAPPGAEVAAVDQARIEPPPILGQPPQPAYVLHSSLLL